MIALSLILPVHNQATIITPVVRDVINVLKSMRIPFECLLVENGSSDGTLSQLRKLEKRFATIRVLTSPKGYGNAVLTGISQSRGRFIGYMPSDGQVDLETLPVLWQEIKSDVWDMVKIKRDARESWSRLIVSRLYGTLVSLVFRVPVIDVNGSPRFMKRTKFASLQIHSGDSFIDTELYIKAYRNGWHIHEYPMKHIDRLGGKSTRSWRTFAEFGGNLWKSFRSF